VCRCTKLIEKAVAIKRENLFAQEALLFEKRGGKGGKAVKSVKAATVQRGIREIIRMIRNRRISKSAFITNGVGISPRTA
jgi:hypothetical protein